MERMEQAVPDTNEQALQHFISNSPWDAEAVMRQVARGADALLGGHGDTLLVIDESGIPKKGKHSAGVARQYCGQLGKVENCQVGVYGNGPKLSDH
jgi:SRSO17 transposase